MSKKFPVIILLFTVSLLPFLTLILYPFGYSVSLISYKILSIISAVICITSGYLLKSYKPDKTDRILLSILPLIQLANTVIYVIKSKSFITCIFMAICFIMCAAISEKIIKSDKAKIFSVTSSSLMFVVIALVSFVAVFFGNFAVNTVVETVASPNGEYYAEVVDSDQGALGGNTVVYAKKSACFNMLIMKIEKSPERIYTGDWGEHENMNIYWKDEKTLIIDSKEYTF